MLPWSPTCAVSNHGVRLTSSRFPTEEPRGNQPRVPNLDASLRRCRDTAADDLATLHGRAAWYPAAVPRPVGGTSTWQLPRGGAATRRRNIHVAAAPRRCRDPSAEYPRGSRGVAATNSSSSFRKVKVFENNRSTRCILKAPREVCLPPGPRRRERLVQQPVDVVRRPRHQTSGRVGVLIQRALALPQQLPPPSPQRLGRARVERHRGDAVDALELPGEAAAAARDVEDGPLRQNVSSERPEQPARKLRVAACAGTPRSGERKRDARATHGPHPRSRRIPAPPRRIA